MKPAAAKPETLLEVSHLKKAYGKKQALKNVSFALKEGSSFGFLGPNGAGKSTTMKILAGIVKADSGSVRLLGRDIARDPRAASRHIGYVPQEITLYEKLSAYDNLVFFGQAYGVAGNDLKRRIGEVLEKTGLRDRARDEVQTYSGGMKRRINIAAAMLHRPKLLILDEPTVGIDPQSRNHILESVRTLNRMGSTIVYTTHYMEEVEAISTRIGILDHGRLIAEGTKEELVRQLAREEKLVIATDGVSPEAVEELRGHRQVERVDVEGNDITVYLQSASTYLQDILFILSNHQVRIRTLNRVEPDLETVFLALTGRTLRD